MNGCTHVIFESSLHKMNQTIREAGMAKQNLLVSRRAPDFSLELTSGPGSPRRRVGLDDFQDRWLILLFYPRDFSLVCPTELTAISGRIEEFQKRGCDVLGISTDPISTHEQWL